MRRWRLVRQRARSDRADRLPWGIGFRGASAAVEHRLRDGKSFVACAPQAFADPSASVARSTGGVEPASPDAVPVGKGNASRALDGGVSLRLRRSMN